MLYWARLVSSEKFHWTQTLPLFINYRMLTARELIEWSKSFLAKSLPIRSSLQVDIWIFDFKILTNLNLTSSNTQTYIIIIIIIIGLQ